jgi:hypothetical protein
MASQKMLKRLPAFVLKHSLFSLASNKIFSMSTNEIASKLIELCRQGKWEEAQKELFADDAVSIEPHATPIFDKETKGLSAIIEKGQKFESMIEEMHRINVSAPIITNNSVAFKLTMEVTMKGRPRETWDEICVYNVKDGKIVSEQFFL